MRATVSHFEIPTRDIERAATFYRRVFGWRIEPRPWSEGDYCQVRTEEPHAPPASALRGAIQGGLAAATGLGCDQPLLVIHLSGGTLPDLLAEISAAGGTIEVAPQKVGETGEFARFRDTEGNLLGLWRANL